MTTAEIAQIVEEVARQELQWEGPLPTGELAEGLDSMQRLSLAVALEDRFRICFEPEEEEKVRTLADLVLLIQRKIT